MNNKKSVNCILGIALISIAIMYILEGILAIEYFQKALLKVVLFLILPIIYTLYDKKIKLRDNFKIESKKSLLKPLLLGLGIYVIILIGYFFMKDFIDLANIIKMLEENVKVNKGNFLWVALYISIVNSLLEEFFFRGFIFLNLKKISGRKSAYIVSAFLFAIYHLAIMGNWFSPLIFIVAIVALFAGGLIFNFLNEEAGNIYSSWLVHMMANLSINTIGFVMFGII